MGAVFTLIAGLLNILAIWDAFEGPAYGFGDEHLDEMDEEENEPKGKDGSQESEDA